MLIYFGREIGHGNLAPTLFSWTGQSPDSTHAHDDPDVGSSLLLLLGVVLQLMLELDWGSHVTRLSWIFVIYFYFILFLYANIKNKFLKIKNIILIIFKIKKYFKTSPLALALQLDLNDAIRALGFSETSGCRTLSFCFDKGGRNIQTCVPWLYQLSVFPLSCHLSTS